VYASAPRRAVTTEEHAKALAAYGFSAADLLAIERENARRLLPQLGKT
jgi:hypothetical protein